MYSLIFILLSALLVITFLLIKERSVLNIFPWQMKIAGVLIALTGALIPNLASSMSDESFRFVIVIIGLLLIVFSTDRIAKGHIAKKKLEVFLMSFLISAIAYVITALINLYPEAAMGSGLFVITVLWLHIFVYHFLLYTSKKR